MSACAPAERRPATSAAKNRTFIVHLLFAACPPPVECRPIARSLKPSARRDVRAFSHRADAAPQRDGSLRPLAPAMLRGRSRSSRMRSLLLLLAGALIGALVAFSAANTLSRRSAWPRGVMVVMQHHY